MASPRVEGLLAQLTLEERVSLLAGGDVWHTVPIERLGIHRLRMSDGPAGVRGTRFGGIASMNVPSGTALAATWDRGLVRKIGELLGREMHSKGAGVHLAPTVNLHRTPVGGRNFECMSEDPLLTAMLAVEYVRGVQSQGVASCIKHFVGNDTEFERMTIDSQIDERTLREVYLVPFERAVKDAGVQAVMTSYNRLNGKFAADSTWLLRDVLRGEWGFDGTIISDWFGLHSTIEGVVAGVDIEMPGPTLHRGKKLLSAVSDEVVTVSDIENRTRQVLTLLERTGALDRDPSSEITRTDDSDVALIREAAASGMVLLKNGHQGQPPTLPLKIERFQSVAVIGPNAATGRIMGGGSAQVTPVRASHPLDAMRARFEPLGVQVGHSAGCNINRRLPELDVRLVSHARVDYFESPDALDDPSAVPAASETLGAFHMTWFTDPLERPGMNFGFGARFTLSFTPDVDGEWSFGVESVAPVQLLLDGVEILENSSTPIGGSFFGIGRCEQRVSVSVSAGRAYCLVAEVRHEPTGVGLGGINLGSQPPVAGDEFERAVDLAARSDVSVVLVGTNSDWESEGWDRPTIELPGEQDALVSAIARVSRLTIVLVNAGSPVAMPWVDEVDAVVYTWFPGQEMGEAIVDVLTGIVEPGGRLPVTLPKRIEDTPASEHHPGRNGAAKYLEGRLIGYRWYDTIGRPPHFPFGFGLGYADICFIGSSILDEYHLRIELSNNSIRDGSQVVQVYAHLLDRRGLATDEPDQRLVGFAKVYLPAGATVESVVELDREAWRTWNPVESRWTRLTGEVELRVGWSSRDFVARHVVDLSA